VVLDETGDVERATRFTILLHLPERQDAQSVAAVMIPLTRSDLRKGLWPA
jgi:hypothetical protein